jgi:hypothetical protein
MHDMAAPAEAISPEVADGRAVCDNNAGPPVRPQVAIAHEDAPTNTVPHFPQMCWANRAHHRCVGNEDSNDTNINNNNYINSTVDCARAVLTTMERSWCLNEPMLVNSWENASGYEGLEHEVTGMWLSEGAVATEVLVSPRHQVLLILTVLHVGTEFRYITPHHTWAHTMDHDGSNLVAVDPEPTPLDTLPVLTSTLMKSPSVSAHAEMRLQLQYLLSNKAGLPSRHPYAITRARCTYSNTAKSTTLKNRYFFSTINTSPTCPGCKTGSDHANGSCNSELEIVADRWFKQVRITCQRSKTTTNVHIGHSTFYKYLFDVGTGHSIPSTPTPVRAPAGFDDVDEPVVEDGSGNENHCPT